MCLVHVVSFFFFKQKTAYEMRISDWSSDVCSSDLVGITRIRTESSTPPSNGIAGGHMPKRFRRRPNKSRTRAIRSTKIHAATPQIMPMTTILIKIISRSEERRVGKEGVVRLDLGGRRIITKQKKLKQKIQTE